MYFKVSFDKPNWAMKKVFNILLSVYLHAYLFIA